jgi:hypothetical protein
VARFGVVGPKRATRLSLPMIRGCQRFMLARSDGMSDTHRSRVVQPIWKAAQGALGHSQGIGSWTARSRRILLMRPYRLAVGRRLEIHCDLACSYHLRA